MVQEQPLSNTRNCFNRCDKRHFADSCSQISFYENVIAWCIVIKTKMIIHHRDDRGLCAQF